MDMKALKQKSLSQPVKVEGVSFNTAFVLSMDEKDFAGHRSNEHLWPGITPELKAQRLSLVYLLSKISADGNDRV